MMQTGPYSDGYAAGITGEGLCPHLPFSVDWMLWQAGEFVGHQTVCAQMEFIFLNFPQD